MLKLIIFGAASAFILFASRKQLLHPTTHGFYRFFAFELIVVLFLINVDYWIIDPFSPLHLLSWILLFGSIYPVVAGFYLLKKIGKPDEKVDSHTDYKFEKTTSLVKSGIYKYIRHPMYASLFYLSIGIFLKDISLLTGVLLLLIILFLILTAKMEEKENITRFGDEYSNYMQSSKMFMPYVL